MLLLLFLVIPCAISQDPLVVDTSSGQVAGRVDDSGLCRVWLGVPYGSASRFRPASTAARWSGVRNSTEFGAACMQPPLPGVSQLSEDCLFLNVFAPLQTPAALLPVIVFVHGGGFQVGASNNYNGSVLAGASDTPVIVVTINYRLNIFGFFYLDDTDVTGINIGMQDQRLALQWVQQNIANFGGDPSRVTIMGESAGSVSAFLHLVDKQSWPLFSSIIGESAGPAVWPTAASVRPQFESYAAKFGCSDLACMQALPAQSITPFLPMGLSPFVYVWSELILPYPPQIMVALNMTRPNTPALVGVNANEATFLSFLYLNYTLQPPSQALFEQIHAAQLALYDPRALMIAAKYYAWDGNSSMQNFYNTAAPLADLVITCSSEIAAGAVGAFRYFWTVAPKKFILTLAGLGATHTCEIPFFFGTGAVFGFEFTPEEAVLAASTAKIVRNFAATGQAPWDKDNVHVFKLDGDNPPPVYDHHCDLWQEILLAKP
jgi:para-nitrobenzyl esterase